MQGDKKQQEGVLFFVFPFLNDSIVQFVMTIYIFRVRDVLTQFTLENTIVIVELTTKLLSRDLDCATGTK